MAHIKIVKIVDYPAIAIASQSKDQKQLHSPIVVDRDNELQARMKTYIRTCDNGLKTDVSSWVISKS